MEAPPADRLSDADRQQVLDEEHLRLLAFFHYVSGGITAGFSLMFGLWFTFMLVMFSMVPPLPAHAQKEFEAFPIAFFAMFGIVFLLGLIYGLLELVAGRLISKRRRRVLTIVLAIPRFLFIPYGLILSVFTLIVLERRSVKRLFEQ